MNWAAWKLDIYTWVWLIWIAWFFIWETYTLGWHKGQELTAHLRPLIQSNSLVWFIAAGTIAWLAYHFLFEKP